MPFKKKKFVFAFILSYGMPIRTGSKIHQLISIFSKLDAFEYLNKGSEPISIGLLLGVGASFFGTMDVLVTKKLATQLEALLPPTATELPLSHNTQVRELLIFLNLRYFDPRGHEGLYRRC